MRVFIRLLLPISIAIIISSCVRIVYITKRNNPEIILEKGHHSVVFVNMFNYTLPLNVNKKDRNSYHEGVMALLDGLTFISSDSIFSFFTGDTLKKGIKAGDLTTLLPADTINNICNRFSSNLLLALDSTSIFFERDTVINSYYGVEYRTINFKLNTRFFLSLYSADGRLIDRSEVEQSSMFAPRSSMPGQIIPVPSISRATNEIGNLSFQAGQDYVAKFYPEIIHDTQQLFTGKPFKESNEFIFAKNWNKATELLDELVRNPDPAIAGKARHNLDVVKEASEADER
jgi:hypothetical protein